MATRSAGDVLPEEAGDVPFPAQDPAIPLRTAALKALARRDCARRELRGRLLRLCSNEALVDAVLDALVTEGLQSDARFANSFLRHRSGQGYGPLRIRQELAQRGTDPAAIEQAFSGCELDWQAQALTVHRKKFGSSRPADFREKARRLRFLQYRGFDSELVSRMLD